MLVHLPLLFSIKIFLLLKLNKLQKLNTSQSTNLGLFLITKSYGSLPLKFIEAGSMVLKPSNAIKSGLPSIKTLPLTRDNLIKL